MEPRDSVIAGAAGRRLVAVLATLLGLSYCLSGCAEIRDQARGTQVDPDTADVQVSRPALETVGVGLLDGMVSVLVRNPSHQVLRRATALITVVDDQGRTMAAGSTSPEDQRCCTAENLPPGATFGFWVQMVDPADDAAPVTGLTLSDLDVSVSYKEVSWSGAGGTGGPVGTAVPVPDPTQQIVPADPADPTQGVKLNLLMSSTAPIEKSMVQAVLNTPGGDLSAVVTSTYYCLTPASAPAQWSMQLFHAVEPGTTIATVTVYPLPGGGASSSGDDPCPATPTSATTPAPAAEAAPAG